MTRKLNLIVVASACIGFCTIVAANLALADDSVVTKTDAMSAGHMSADHMGMMKKPPMKKTDMEKSDTKSDAMSADHMAPDPPK
jgi:pentapeptide MXKDX repeat protein